MSKNEQNITTYNIDLNNPPVLTQRQQAMLNNLASMPDAHIDYSDIPAFIRSKDFRSLCHDKDIRGVHTQGEIVASAF